MVELRIDSVTKRYDDEQGTEIAVDDLSLIVEDELLVLLGPSGCGKTTTLRMIAGLEDVTDGRITIDDRDVTGVHPSNRSIAMAFQDFGLYTTMNVRKNIGYGLKHSTDLSATERAERVEAIAAKFDIEELLDRDVTELSGGQKQRVSLARAMVREPDVFLLDEPLASLDAKLRAEMRTELQQLQSEMDITTVYVTHNQKEAMTMGDKIAVLDDGVLRQIGPPNEVYDDPADAFVADFLGSPSMNQLPAQVTQDGGNLALDVESGDMGDEYNMDAPFRVACLPEESIDVSPGGRVTVGVRPEHIRLPADSPESFEASVSVTEYQGNENFVHIRAGGHDLTVVVPPGVNPEIGETVSASVPVDRVHVFDSETGEALRTGGKRSATRASDRTSADPTR